MATVEGDQCDWEREDEATMSVQNIHERKEIREWRLTSP